MPPTDPTPSMPVQNAIKKEAPQTTQPQPSPEPPQPPVTTSPVSDVPSDGRVHRPARPQTTQLAPEQATDFQGNRADTNIPRVEASVAAPISATSPNGQTAVVPPPGQGVTISPNATAYAALPPHKQPPVADNKGNWFGSLLTKLEHFSEEEWAKLKAEISKLEAKPKQDTQGAVPVSK